MTYKATFLTAAPGSQLVKIFEHDPMGEPVDYVAGKYFRVEERAFENFDEFVDALAVIPRNQCIIRGAPLDHVGQQPVTRTLHDRPEREQHANFRDAKRKWIVFDFDSTPTEFDGDPENLENAIHDFVQSLPDFITTSAWAFFPSAKAHLANCVRGKLLVPLEKAITCAEASQVAKALGADPCVCRPVEPNFFARPIFRKCKDPLQGRRHPIRGEGQSLARLPLGITDLRSRDEKGKDDKAKDDTPTSRAQDLARLFQKRWLLGGRIQTNAALHLFGWLLGQGWTRGEIKNLVRILDAQEPSAEKREEHLHILRNAMPLEGPGSFREWVGIRKWRTIDQYVNGRSELVVREDDIGIDPWEDFWSFSIPPPPIDWICQGLRLAPSLGGKISLLAGPSGAGKGPLADYLGLSVALGRKAWGDLSVRQTNVAILDKEGRYLTALRLRRMASGIGVDPRELDGKIFLLDAGDMGDLRAAENVGRLRDLIEKHAIGLVILDSYTSAMLGIGVESNQPEFASLASAWGRLPVCTLAIAHANKVGSKSAEPHLYDIAYSGALGSLAQTAIMVWHPDIDDDDHVAVKCARSPTTKFARKDLLWQGEEEEPLKLSQITVEEPPNAAVLDSVRRREEAAVGLENRIEKLRSIVADNPGGIPVRVARDGAGIAGRHWIPTYTEALRRGVVRLAPALPNDRHPLIVLGVDTVDTLGCPRVSTAVKDAER